MCGGWWMAGESEPGRCKLRPPADKSFLWQSRSTPGWRRWMERMCERLIFKVWMQLDVFAQRAQFLVVLAVFTFTRSGFFGDKLRCVVRWQGRSQVFNLRPRNSPVLITINPRSVLKLLQYIVASQTLHMREESGSLWLWCNYEEVKKALTQPRKTLMHDEIEHKECDGDDFYNIVIVYWYCI